MSILLVLPAAAQAAAAPAAQGAPQAVVTGVVQDQTGAILTGAAVDLLNAAGNVVQSATTDGAGAFRFERVAAGPYQIRATYEGFKPASTNLRVGARAPSPQRLVLNDLNFVGTVGSPLFGQPVSARPARQLQCSARLKF